MFPWAGADAAAQAKLFVKTVGTFGAGDLAVLDIEVTDNQPPAAVAKWSNDFVGNVMALTGLPPSRVLGAAVAAPDLSSSFFPKRAASSPVATLVYTGAWFWNPDAGGSDILSAHPLWVSGAPAGFGGQTGRTVSG